MKIKLILVLFIVTFVGCKNIERLTQFHLEYNQTIEIPSSTILNLPFNLFTPDIESNSESSFAINDTRKDLVEEITIKKLALNLESPENGDFGFLKSIEIFIFAEGVPDIKIAWKNEISSSAGKYLELETTETDLKEFAQLNIKYHQTEVLIDDLDFVENTSEELYNGMIEYLDLFQDQNQKILKFENNQIKVNEFLKFRLEEIYNEEVVKKNYFKENNWKKNEFLRIIKRFKSCQGTYTNSSIS